MVCNVDCGRASHPRAELKSCWAARSKGVGLLQLAQGPAHWSEVRRSTHSHSSSADTFVSIIDLQFMPSELCAELARMYGVLR